VSVLNLCFAVPHAYALFEPASREVFGGAEVRALAFATALAKLPDVGLHFVVFHDKGVERERFGLIEVWRDPTRTPVPARTRYGHLLHSALEWLRASPVIQISGHSVPEGRAKVLDAVGADVYGVFGASDYAAELVAYCHARRKKLVLFLSSGGDLSADYRADSLERNVYGSRHDLCHYSLTRAHLVVAQTAAQQSELRRRFGRESALIPNPVELSPAASTADRVSRKHVLWVGKADRVKGPEEMLSLAARFPGLRFVLVMNRSVPEFFERISTQRPQNVDIREFVRYQDSDALFRDALALVSTSVFEGFPNTFLQAGKHGVPVLSLNVDPDGFLSTHGCGIHAGGDFERLVQGLSLLHNDEASWQLHSQRIADHVRANHDLAYLAGRLKDVLRELK
jgi:glycosyltransferase involved in cell wall biosynthesis